MLAVVYAATALTALPAASQTSKLNHLPPARAPCSVLSGHPCHPSFCGVFHRGPCFPDYLPALGQTLRLTIVSTDDNDPANKNSGDADKSGGDANATSADVNKKDDDADVGGTDDHALDTIGDMFAALRACWVPPPKDAARHGMEYTIRFAFKRDGEGDRAAAYDLCQPRRAGRHTQRLPRRY